MNDQKIDWQTVLVSSLMGAMITFFVMEQKIKEKIAESTKSINLCFAEVVEAQKSAERTLFDLKKANQIIQRCHAD